MTNLLFKGAFKKLYLSHSIVTKEEKLKNLTELNAKYKVAFSPVY